MTVLYGLFAVTAQGRKKCGQVERQASRSSASLWRATLGRQFDHQCNPSLPPARRLSVQATVEYSAKPGGKTAAREIP